MPSVHVSGDPVYDGVLTLGFAFVVFIVIAQRFVQSPYGRFASGKMGVNLDPRLGWWLMELPATVVFVAVFALGARRMEPMALILGGVWLLHYANRGWFFPLTLRVAPGKKSSFSITVVLAGWFVTGMHGYLNAAWFTEYGDHLTVDWLTDPRFIAGALVYYSGLALVVHSERVVRNLRDPNADGPEYRIPYGGGFRFVTNPAYLGELVGWAGFALMTWSWAGVLIFAISAANLVPRAFATHRWYQERFPDYPTERKVLVPGLL